MYFIFRINSQAIKLFKESVSSLFLFHNDDDCRNSFAISIYIDQVCFCQREIICKIKKGTKKKSILSFFFIDYSEFCVLIRFLHDTRVTTSVLNKPKTI